jgi:DUF4097 and DUF4098 domain-containing protein YvlB
VTRLPIILLAAAVPAVAHADSVTKSAKVKGAPEVRISTISGDITVVKGAKGQVSAVFDTSRPSRVLFDVGKKRIRIGGGSPSDEIHVSVPTGTEVVVNTTSGEVSVTGIGGDVRGRTTSGSLKIEDAAAVDTAVVSGDVRITRASGDARIKVVSGDVYIDQGKRDDTKLSLESVSGDIEWRGRCAKGCRIDLQSLSGDLDLYADPKSSFDLEFRSRSGDFKNRAKAQVSKSSGSSVEATYGTGLGRIQAVTFSGDLRLETQ